MHRKALRVMERARDTGYRGLLVLNGDREELVRDTAEAVGGDCLLVGDSPVRGGYCRRELPPARFQEALGSEYPAAIISLESMVRPSIIAGIAETVRGGGFLAIVGGPWASWTPGPREGGTGLYKEYLEHVIPRARLHAWIDEGRVRSSRLEASTPPPREGPEGYRPRYGVPRRLLREAATRGQAEVLDRLVGFITGRARSFLLRGDRGRGKSYVIGLALAAAARLRLIGRATVLGPSPASVASLMRGLGRGLRVLGVPHRVVSSGGYVVRYSGPWYRVSYESPETVEPSPLLVVDEAGVVGVARVRSLAWKSGKMIVSTTVHGYEGSGRVFAGLIEGQLPKPLEKGELEEPIRYPPGDPLEEWIYEAFLLKAEPPEATSLGDVGYRRVERRELARDHQLLSQVVGILVQAHYRNTPDNLLLLLEGDHEVHILESSGGIVAVADTLVESMESPREARLVLEKLRVYAVPEEVSGVRLLRVSRIAVAPRIQRRGLGSRLLGEMEHYASMLGVDAVVTIYSRHDVIPFWLKNGYETIYISPRYNRVTGEKNIAMAKPLTKTGATIVEAASCNMKQRLVETLASIYRDLAAEKVALLLSNWRRCRHPKPQLTRNQVERLKMYLEGMLDMEQAMDPIIKLVSWITVTQGLEEGDILIVARILQGKTWSDTAAITGYSIEDAQKTLNKKLIKLLK